MVALLLAGGAVAFAQTPAFEVASVTPNPSNSGSQSAQTAKGSLTLTNMPARMLIVNAYNVRPDRLVGGPSWLDSERFDVNARAASPERPTVS